MKYLKRFNEDIEQAGLVIKDDDFVIGHLSDTETLPSGTPLLIADVTGKELPAISDELNNMLSDFGLFCYFEKIDYNKQAGIHRILIALNIIPSLNYVNGSILDVLCKSMYPTFRIQPCSKDNRQFTAIKIAFSDIEINDSFNFDINTLFDSIICSINPKTKEQIIPFLLKKMLEIYSNISEAFRGHNGAALREKIPFLKQLIVDFLTNLNKVGDKIDFNSKIKCIADAIMANEKSFYILGKISENDPDLFELIKNTNNKANGAAKLGKLGF